MKLKLSGEGYSPAVLRKIVRQGGKAASFAEAADDLRELAEVRIDPTHVRRLTERIGRHWAAVRDRKIEDFRRDRLPRMYEMAPAAAAVMLDGGRVQTRAADGGRGAHAPEWKETKVACCLSLASVERTSDPQPEPPAKFLDRVGVPRLAAELRRSAATGPRRGGAPRGRRQRRGTKKKVDSRPHRLVRTVTATLRSWEEFGFQVAAEVHRRGLDRASRKACVCDGSAVNWSLFALHLEPAGFVAVLDFLHLLAWLYAAAQAAASEAHDGWTTYECWLRLAWKGRVDELLERMRAAAGRVGPPPTCGEADPRRVLAEAVGYVSNNRGRMNYPECRRLGLPISSAPVESAIKQINRRIKGSEKFWLSGGAEAVLQVRTAYLSEDDRAQRLWSLPRPWRAPAPDRFRKAS